MKFRQEFRVAAPRDAVWRFFEQPLRVAACLPGLETVDTVDDDTLSVRITQKLGPMSATFDARVDIVERIPGERIAFTSVGKAVRGAAGNFRAENIVHLVPIGNETDVVVEGEAALAGVLGTVAHPIIKKQAAKVTVAFAHNLAQALATDGPAAGGAAPGDSDRATDDAAGQPHLMASSGGLGRSH